MKVISLLALVLITALGPSLCLTSCASSGGGGIGDDGTYSPPPALSPVDATERLRSEYREWIR
jgi:hypothetical protein